MIEFFAFIILSIIAVMLMFLSAGVIVYVFLKIYDKLDE